MSIKTQTLEVSAGDIALDGRGIADYEGKTILVKGLAPGETAEVNIVAKSRHHNKNWADIVSFKTKEPTIRQAPACPSHGDCGGCTWQHINYQSQCLYKQKHVKDSLSPFVENDKDIVLPFIPSPKAIGYRNKGIYVVAGNAPRLFLGAYAPGTHTPITTLGCKTVSPEIDQWAHTLCNILNELKVPPYDDVSNIGWMRYALIRSGKDGQCHITLIGKDVSPMATVEKIATSLLEQGACGVAWIQNDHTDGRVMSEHPKHLGGKETITESLNGQNIEVSPFSFFQVNRDSAKILYQKVAELLRPSKSDRVLDLFCGVGGFIFHLADAVQKAHGIEFNPSCIESAQKHALAYGSKATFEEADAKGVNVGDANVVVINPPRKGLGEKLCQQLRQPGIEKLAYVSCNPVSLAKDLETLSKTFELSVIQSIDLMPGTGHVETIVILTRRHGH